MFTIYGLSARAAEHRYTNHYVPHAAVYRHHCASRESQFLLVSSFRQLIESVGEGRNGKNYIFHRQLQPDSETGV